MPRISPSSLDYYRACPCFKFKEFKREGSAAEEGTKMHAAFETGEDDELNDEQRRRVEQTRQLIDAQKTSYLGWRDDDPAGFRMHHEEKMKLSSGLSGKMDRCYVNLKDRKALVFDSKYGRLGLIAEASDSMQMLAYADIVFYRYPGMIDEVRCVLGSPRTNELSVHDYKVSEWEGIQKQIQAVIDEVEDSFKKPRMNDAVCCKCDLIDRCPLAKKDAIVPAAETALGIPAHVLLKPVEDLDARELAVNRAMIDLLEAWAEKRKPMVDQRVFQEGIDLPGYTKVRKEGSPYIPADMTGRAWELLRDELTVEQFVSACGKPSLSKLIDQLAEHVPGDSLSDRKEAARAHLFEKVEEIVQQMKSSEYLRRKAKLDLRLIGAGSE